MKRTFTNVGKEYTDGKQDEIGAMFERLEWHEIPYTMGMGPGLGIKEAIKQLRIPKVSHVADSHELAPYGLMGVIGHYKNGEARIYLIDIGTEVIVLASDFEAS